MKNELEQGDSDFEAAGDEKPLTLPMEFLLFIRENKAWWMVPILLVLGAIGLLAVFGEAGGVPWIYTFF